MTNISIISDIDFIDKVQGLTSNNNHQSILLCDSLDAQKYWLQKLAKTQIDHQRQDNRQQFIEQTYHSFTINTWQSWINNLWQQYSKYHPNDSKQLLNSDHREFLFLDIINQLINNNKNQRAKKTLDTQHFSNSNVNAICHDMIRSWQFINDHQIDFAQLSQSSSLDHLLFYQLCHEYNTRLDSHHWLDSQQLEAEIINYIESLNTDEYNRLLPDWKSFHIYLSGFNQISPKQQAFIDVLSRLGCQFSRVKHHIDFNPQAPIKVNHETFNNIDDELTALADYIKNLNQDTNHIAVFVANLASVKQDITHVFTQHFNEATDYKNLVHNKTDVSWHINSASRVNEFPAIDILEAMFNCGQTTFDYRHFSKLLLSPYFFQTGDINHFQFRHYIDKSLRESLSKKVSLAHIIEALNQLADTYRLSVEGDVNHQKHLITNGQYHFFLSLVRGLQAFSQSLEGAVSFGFQSFNQAAKWLSEQLSQLQWIGYFDFQQVDIDHRNQQYIQSLINNSDALHYLHDALDKLSTLNILLPSKGSKQNNAISLSVFQQRLMAQLSKMTLKTSFNQASTHVEFFDMLSSDSLVFDHVWLLNINDNDWPAKKKYYAFIPAHILHQTNDVTLNSKALYDHARDLTIARILSSRHCQISSAKFMNDCEVMSSSVLLSLPNELIHITTIDHQDVTTQTNKPPENITEYQWQSYVSESAPTLIKDTNPSQNINIPGGAQAIKNQISCPFRAWVSERLGIKSLEETEVALHPKLHGISIHRILEIFWKKIRNHQTLDALYENNTIDAVIDDTISAFFSQSKIHQSDYDNLQTMYSPLLHKLIKEWLDFELTRPEFSVIAQELKQTLTINRATLHLTIDRIDRLDDNHFLIIDYKSGKTDITNWYGKAIKEPQLPMYLLMLDNAADNPSADNSDLFEQKPKYGIAYASLNSKDISLKGVANGDNHNGLLTSVTGKGRGFLRNYSSFEELSEYWREEITNACDNFASGQHPVLPLKQVCDYCQFSSACRINQLRSSVDVLDHENNEFGGN